MGGASKAGPCVTDHGNFILDAQTPGEIADPEALDAALRAVPGVVETGLFCRMAAYAYFGLADGSVREATAPWLEGAKK